MYLFEGEIIDWLADGLVFLLVFVCIPEINRLPWLRSKSWWKQFGHYGLSDKQWWFFLRANGANGACGPPFFGWLYKGTNQIPLGRKDALCTSLRRMETWGYGLAICLYFPLLSIYLLIFPMAMLKSPILILSVSWPFNSLSFNYLVIVGRWFLYVILFFLLFSYGQRKRLSKTFTPLN